MARTQQATRKPFLAFSLMCLLFGHDVGLSAQEVLSTPCERMNSIWHDSFGDMGIGWGYGSSRLWYAGEEVWFTLGEPSEEGPKRVYLLVRDTADSPREVVAEAEFPGTVSYTFESHRFIDELEVWVDWDQPGPKATLLDAGCEPSGDSQPFAISLGVNDAWYVPELDGHGVLLTVYPSLKKLFLALFTFDVEAGVDGSDAILGAAGQRWLTAVGPYEGDTAHLTVDLTVGGVFLEAEPVPKWFTDGSMDLKLNHCNSVTLSYDIPSINRRGTLQLRRLADDRVELCELLTVTEHG